MRKKQIIKTIAAVVFFITVAVLCRYIIFSYPGLSPFADKLLNYTRIFTYIGMFSVWGVTVSRRVMQQPVRRMLIAIAVLIVFWLVTREFRYRYVFQPDLLRFLWYMYYIPILTIPLLALYISVFLGKSNDYQMPKNMRLFSIPTAVLILLVLTNDLHQFAFHFPDNTGVGSNADYQYGWLFYAVTAWVYFCSVLSFAFMIKKLRIPKGKMNALLPLLPFVTAIVYGILYAIRVPFVIKYLGDLSVVFCLVFAGFFESCIDCGLIQSNSRYSDLFIASVNTPVQILDKEYRLRYAASASETISVEDIKQAKAKPSILNSEKRLHTISIRGGYAVWTEDISELFRLHNTLTERREELNERNALLQLEYKKEKEHKTVAEQNRLYDLLQRKTQLQLDKIDACVQRYQNAESEMDKQRILAHIVIFGTFIKRRKDFVLSMENADEFPEMMISNALAESFRALRLLGIKGSYYIHTNRDYLSGKMLSYVYDFFEDVMETVLNSTNFINFRFCEVNGALRISIMTDVKIASSYLKIKYPKIKIINDEGSEFILTLEGGAEDA